MMHQEDKDLEMIKRRKLLKYYREYLASQLKKVEESKKADEDVYIKVKPLFRKDAYNWLINIKKNKPTVADEILKAILYLVLNGMAGIPVEYELVELLRRKIEGETGKIYVYRRGEMKEFGDVLREKKD